MLVFFKALQYCQLALDILSQRCSVMCQKM